MAPDRWEPPARTGRIVCLLSGGIDSAALLYRLHRSGHDAVPLFIDYGQRAAAQELAAASGLCAGIGAGLERIHVPGLSAIGNGLSDPGPHTSPVFHARNLILLSIAASYAASRSAAAVGIGAHCTPSFPDQGGAFIQRAEAAISASLGTRMRVFAPFCGLDKLEVARLAADAGVPIGATYSCYMGGTEPCGSCPSCTDRRAALKVLVENI
ncbi:MAG: 7-cyano-7-deazaguanine synthase [Nitrosopumilus sp.]|nr:7-cyano-7-deazaguanine synthase [Nitrosopumilus sp.]MDA7944125.1 7-cyano-7-deazaguanine synthase [Nitrosopumilus sp.]MDA7999531.1 7-cyano-7-deazaguanine synthase [Nitrosopumilus sp.]